MLGHHVYASLRPGALSETARKVAKGESLCWGICHWFRLCSVDLVSWDWQERVHEPIGHLGHRVEDNVSEEEAIRATSCVSCVCESP